MSGFSTENTVETVCGTVEASSLGVVLPHEHVIHRIDYHSGRPDNCCVDIELVAKEVARFGNAGGGTIVDVTPIGVGRDPVALRQVAEKSGVSILSGVGLYQLECWPKELRQMSEDDLAFFLASEVDGASTGITAALLGEIASHNENHADWRRYALWNDECHIFRAVAKAQRVTGLTISTHAALGRHGVAQLRTIIQGGGDAERVIIGHCDAQAHDDIDVDLNYYHTLLSEGVTLEFDMFGWEELISDAQRFERVAQLAREGLSGRILLSMDTCRLSQLHQFGGRGFDYLFRVVFPGLRQAGVTDQQLYQMTVLNPASLLARRCSS